MEGPSTSLLNSDRRHTDDVAVDHSLHRLALLGAAAYAWKLHGLLTAIAVLIGLLLIISLSNLAILGKGGSFRVVRVNRWSWLVLAFVFLALSGASGGRV